MTDLVERLRKGKMPQPYNVVLEAADEIERLRTALEAELKSKALARQFSSVGMIGALEDANTWLREALRQIIDRYPDHENMLDIARNTLAGRNTLVDKP